MAYCIYCPARKMNSFLSIGLVLEPVMGLFETCLKVREVSGLKVFQQSGNPREDVADLDIK